MVQSLNPHCEKCMCILLKGQQGKVSILFSKEVAELLLALAHLRIEVLMLEGTWRLEHLFEEWLVCESPTLTPKRKGCVWGVVLSPQASSGA